MNATVNIYSHKTRALIAKYLHTVGRTKNINIEIIGA